MDDGKTAEEMSLETGIKSIRLLERLIEEVRSALPGPIRVALRRGNHQEATSEKEFPELKVSPAIEDLEEKGGSLLFFKTTEYRMFSGLNRKTLYITSVKVLNLAALAELKESKWSEVFAPGSSPRGSWRSP